MNKRAGEMSVEVVPASKSPVYKEQTDRRRVLRVAAYCRVSTDEESQNSSYFAQKFFYKKLIGEHNGWELAGIYADKAASGTSMSGRENFLRMLDDAVKGKMDYIVTKSISRFARNTLDTLSCVRRLKQLEPPVGIYFEKENIDTLDASGELILTILSALAQDESRSISDNIRWGIQKKFQRGEGVVNPDRLLGYKNDNDSWAVDEEQAQIVRFIYSSFLGGMSANRIAAELNSSGKKTIKGNSWRADAVLYVLRNEKYVGDCENQKTITVSYLTHRSIKNRGEAPKYYVKNHHMPLVERSDWEKVQAMLDGKAPQSRGAKPSVFKNLHCSCGGSLVRSYYSRRLSKGEGGEQTDADGRKPYYTYAVWKCNCCSKKGLLEISLEQSFMEEIYRLKADFLKRGQQSELIKKINAAIDEQSRNYVMTELLQEQLNEQRENLTKLERQGEWALADEVRAKTEELTREIADFKEKSCESVRRKADFFLDCLKKLPDNLSVRGNEKAKSEADFLMFDKGLYSAFVTGGIVYGDRVTYTLSLGAVLDTKDNLRRVSDYIGYRLPCNNGYETITGVKMVRGVKITYKKT